MNNTFTTISFDKINTSKDYSYYLREKMKNKKNKKKQENNNNNNVVDKKNHFLENKKYKMIIIYLEMIFLIMMNILI